MRVAYGDSNVLRCSVQFAYDRFIHAFNYDDVTKQVVNTPDGIVNSKDQVFVGLAQGRIGKATDDFSKDPRYQSTGGPNDTSSSQFRTPKKKVETSRGTRYR